MLDHPLVLLASNWKAWMHPRGKDGRFIETLAAVNIFAKASDAVGDHRAPRRRARITKLTQTHAEVRYFDPHGTVIAADPAIGFPDKIPADEIRGKISLAPHVIARLDGLRDRNMWYAISAQFNADLKENPPPGKSHNADGKTLTIDSPEWAEHKAYVDDVLDRAAVAGITSGEYLMDHDDNWNKETLDYFQSIVNEEIAKVKARGVPQNNHAVMLGGLPGSGKSTLAGDKKSVFSSSGLLDQDKWATVNPDYFKELLIQRGEVPLIDGLSPMETAPLFHSLSSEISHMFGRELMAQGFNIVLDLTMRGTADEKTGFTPPEVEAKVMEGLGYKVDAIFVDLPVDIAMERQKARHLRGFNQLQTGESTLGGRVVPPNVTQRRPDRRSDSAVNFWKMVDAGTFSSWGVVDTSTRDNRISAAGAGTTRADDPTAFLKDPANIPGAEL